MTFNKHQSVFTLAASLGLFAQDDDEQHPSALVVTTPEVIAPIPEKKRSKQRLHHVSFAPLGPTPSQGERGPYQPTRMVRVVPDRKGRSSRRNKGIIAKPTVPQYVASANDFPVTGTPVTPSPITGAWASLGERRAAVLNSDFVDPAILKQQEHERRRVAYRKREKHFCQLEKLGQIDFDFSELETDYIDEDRVDVTATLVRHGGAQLSVETDGNQVAWNHHLDTAAEVQKEADRQAQMDEYHYFLDNEAGPDVAAALEDLEEELGDWETHEPDAITIQTGGWFE